MHEMLLLGIAASELCCLLTADSRRWRGRVSLFTFLVILLSIYSLVILGVGAPALFAALACILLWFFWDLVDPSARGVVARWALASLGFVILQNLDPARFPWMSLHVGRSIDIVIALIFLVTGPVNHFITAILLCARSQGRDAVPGWITVPEQLPLPARTQRGPEEKDNDEAAAAQPPVPTVPALRGGRWIGPLERLLIIVLAVADAQIAIAAVVAAKGVIRFPEISQDSSGEKAEEFLIGSLSSWILATLVALFMRATLAL